MIFVLRFVLIINIFQIIHHENFAQTFFHVMINQCIVMFHCHRYIFHAWMFNCDILLHGLMFDVIFQAPSAPLVLWQLTLCVPQENIRIKQVSRPVQHVQWDTNALTPPFYPSSVMQGHTHQPTLWLVPLVQQVSTHPHRINDLWTSWL